jgi:hypothetical protein
LGDGPNPVSTYYSTKKDNEGFFKQANETKVDFSKFGTPNYMTAPKPSVGVASHKVYYTHDQYDKR